LNFDDAGTAICAQQIRLELENMKEGVVPLKVVKFQNVNHLSLLIQSNYGSPTTKLNSLVIFGFV